PLVDLSIEEELTFAVCTVMLVFGIALFNLGADLSMTPMGEHVGFGLTKANVLLLVIVCFIMGVLITVAEPDLSVLAGQVKNLLDGNSVILIVVVGLGVGFFLVLSICKILHKSSLSMMLMFFYLLLFALCSILVINEKTVFLPLSFDSGGVTTGPITVPFIMALGVGVASAVGGKNANENSFGLIAMCSIGPILAVLVFSFFFSGTGIALENYEMNLTTEYVLGVVASTSKEVIVSIGLIILFFFILQFTVLHLPKQRILQMTIGLLFTFIGLVIFLSAVSVGYMPVGYKLGVELAENPLNTPLVPILFAFIMGAVVVLAEPAVNVLNKQVEEITGGTVTKKSMLIALSVGVGISIGLSVIRIYFGFSILYYLIPGYILSLGLSFFVPKLYTAIAFDSGGVASGPLTSSFILPLAIGLCSVQAGAEVLNLAFGIVAMVAMTPL
ncbi:MAG: DUF1538 domain-containing protein, partial [Clostridia bacterium]|nr:DUF1538 domain-containing protein [Clostridia bacterium]